MPMCSVPRNAGEAVGAVQMLARKQENGADVEACLRALKGGAVS